MGEAKRLRDMGIQMKALQPGQQIQIGPEALKNAIPAVCECGCQLFIPAMKVYTISALMSPTGQELTANQAVLVCQKCQKVLEGKKERDE